MNIFLKIILGLGAIALLVALAGMYKFNILEDDIYTKDKDGKIIHIKKGEDSTHEDTN